MRCHNVVWDFDGTLALSISHHRELAVQIALLLGVTIPPDDRLGLRTIQKDIRIEELRAYRDVASFHRLIAELTVGPVELCLKALSYIGSDGERPHFVCSSSRKLLVMRALGEYANLFTGVFAQEQGEKPQILKGLSHRPTILITDSIVDVKRAIEAEVVPIGVSWGVDTSDHLLSAGCVQVFDTEIELIDYLREN